jgi:hypothetical protein
MPTTLTKRYPLRAIRTILVVVGSVTTVLGTATAAAADSTSSESAAHIFKTAVKDSSGAGSFTVSGTVDQPKMDLTLDLSLSASGISEGSLVINGEHVQIRRIDGIGYFKGDAAFWTNNASAAAAQEFAGKWIYAPIRNSLFSGLRSFLSPRTFVQAFFGSDQGPFTKKGLTKIDGTRVVGVMADGPGTMFVAESGSPYIVGVQGSQGTSSGSLRFSAYGDSVHAVKPTGAVNLGALENQ